MFPGSELGSLEGFDEMPLWKFQLCLPCPFPMLKEGCFGVCGLLEICLLPNEREQENPKSEIRTVAVGCKQETCPS